jgi:addiction module HigA family antidote
MIKSDSEKLVRSHPGAVLRGILEDICVSQRRFGAHISVTPAYISDIVNARRGVSPLMAHKIAAALGGSAILWVRLQANWDEQKAR